MTWKKIINEFLETDTGQNLKKSIASMRKEKTIYPEPQDVFVAFDETILPYEKTRIVIVGQDPYPNGEANGYAFASKKSGIPKSLEIIFKELHRSVYSYVGDETFKKWFASPDLSKWHKQGILSLNAVLTVEHGKPKSHWDMGWEEFLSIVLKKLNDHQDKLVFMLWGAKAHEYENLLDGNKHLVLKGAHPAADLYGTKRFVGCDHFKEAINFLAKNNGYNRCLTGMFELYKYIDMDGLKKDYINSIVNNKAAVGFDPQKKLDELIQYLYDDYHLYGPFYLDLTTTT
jgi:uracil-DNA glycosylase